MKKLTIIFFIFLLVTSSSSAQLKLSIGGGISSNTNKQTDSLFYAKQKGTALRVNGAYYWGRVGLGTTITHNSFAAIPAFANTTPRFPDTVTTNKSGGGGYASSVFAIGPELCLCYKKIKIIPTIKIGVANSKVDTTKIELRPFNGVARKYESTLANKNSLAIGVGTSITLKLTKLIGITISADYWTYKVQTSLQDYRAGNTAKKIAQTKRLLNVGGGLYFNFSQ